MAELRHANKLYKEKIAQEKREQRAREKEEREKEKAAKAATQAELSSALWRRAKATSAGVVEACFTSCFCEDLLRARHALRRSTYTSEPNRPSPFHMLCPPAGSDDTDAVVT